MSSPSPLQAPGARDYFLLDGEKSPGICRIISGGGRKIKIEDQPQPLTLGANTVVRRLENVVTTWGFRLWLPEHFAQRDRWQAMLEAGGLKQNPRVYRITDLRAPALARVVYEAEEPEDFEKPGGPWTWKLTLHQYSRLGPYGGPVKPPQNAVEQAINDISNSNKSLKQQIAAAQAAKAAGK